MGKATTAVGVVAGFLALLVGGGWLGLQVKPKPYSPHPEGTRELDAFELPSELPEPVRRHFRATSGERVPRVETAVVWGRGEFNLHGMLGFPMRFKSYHVAGREFRRDLELTWFGMPIFHGYDAYIDGTGSFEFNGLFGLLNVSDSGEKLEQSDNLVMWAEAPFTTPSALVLYPRIRWEPIDGTSARLVFPFLEQEEDSLRVEFDLETGLMTNTYGMRYRDQEETKAPFRGEALDWATVHGIQVPHENVGTWEDWEEPYIILDLDGVEYNVDVSEKIPPDSFEADGTSLLGSRRYGERS